MENEIVKILSEIHITIVIGFIGTLVLLVAIALTTLDKSK